MELRRSRHGKAALVISGNNLIKYLTATAYCPAFAHATRKEFLQEYNKVLPITIEAAALSFIKLAKNAMRHNQDVINFLLEEILMKNISEMTLAELVSRYNSLAVAAGKKPRKSFDSKKAALEAFEKLDAEVKVPTTAQEQLAEKPTLNRSSKMTENTEKKPRGKGIGAMAMELLIAGKSTQEVIDEVKAAIEGANPTPATISWYKNKLRQEGKLPPSNRKAKADKGAEEAAPEGSAEQTEDAA